MTSRAPSPKRGFDAISSKHNDTTTISLIVICLLFIIMNACMTIHLIKQYKATSYVVLTNGLPVEKFPGNFCSVSFKVVK